MVLPLDVRAHVYVSLENNQVVEGSSLILRTDHAYVSTRACTCAPVLWPPCFPLHNSHACATTGSGYDPSSVQTGVPTRIHGGPNHTAWLPNISMYNVTEVITVTNVSEALDVIYTGRADLIVGAPLDEIYGTLDATQVLYKYRCVPLCTVVYRCVPLHPLTRPQAQCGPRTQGSP